MPVVSESITINADRETVFAIAADMEQYPRFMPDVESVAVTERREDGSTVTEWVTNVEGTPIIWTEVDEFDLPTFTIRYRLIQGDLDKFEGDWTFTELPEGTLVTLKVDYDFGIPNLTELIGPTLELKVRENSQMMLKGMKQEIENSKLLQSTSDPATLPDVQAQ